jgi:hypothetical protein
LNHRTQTNCSIKSFTIGGKPTTCRSNARAAHGDTENYKERLARLLRQFEAFSRSL